MAEAKTSARDGHPPTHRYLSLTYICARARSTQHAQAAEREALRAEHASARAAEKEEQERAAERRREFEEEHKKKNQEAAAALKKKREAERLERAKAEASKARAQGKNVTYEEAEQGSGPLSCAC